MTSQVLLQAIFSGAVVAAVIGFVANTYFARRKSLEEERNTVRDRCASAQQAVFNYKELPYAIRRRNADSPAEERVRLSEIFRLIQSDLAYYEAWTIGESQALGDAFDKLLKQLRREAGGACRAAWQAAPISSDAEMNIDASQVNLSGLLDYEIAFEEAVRSHLASFSKPKALFVRPGTTSRRGSVNAAPEPKQVRVPQAGD